MEGAFCKLVSRINKLFIDVFRMVDAADIKKEVCCLGCYIYMDSHRRY